MSSKILIQYLCAVISLLSAVVLAFLSFFLDGHAIDKSILIYIAQMLVFSASIFGIRGLISDIKSLKNE